MIKRYDEGIFLLNGKEIIKDDMYASQKIQEATGKRTSREEAKKGTITWPILDAHNSGDASNLRLKFDSMTSHDITYVGIIQTARASGMKEFPVPYVLTNCHNSLCAVGGTINEDDHMFALSAAKKYGGIFVPTNMAVIHSYNREMMAGCGKMILGSDSHTRYGALGTMAVGEGGGELAKQLVGRTYDMPCPEVVAVYLTGKPQPGVGPQDVALAIIGSVFSKGYVKNKVMEFVGDGVDGLPVEYRNGIDVMTTETTCWSSIWRTDEKVKDYLEMHRRAGDYQRLEPADIAYYEGCVYVDLSKIEPMIALPFHPANTYTIRELKANAADIFDQVEKDCLKAINVPGLTMNLQSKIRDGGIYVDQGIVAGCSGGTFDNIALVAEILDGGSTGNGTFKLGVYPGSQAINLELIKNGSMAKIVGAGGLVHTAFCGPCFGAGDTPANGELSIRHTTRNFPNREGSKPGEGQLASVALMDARSIAATALNGGRLTAATEIEIKETIPTYYFDKSIYDKRVYNGVGKAEPDTALTLGPNIKDWPCIPALTDDLLIKVVSRITDPVTTTDELIPSGETSSYRSNPLRLAEFTLSRKDPDYVRNAKAVNLFETDREQGGDPLQNAEIAAVYEKIKTIAGYEEIDAAGVGIGSTIYARKPGDGSAREQAASCQRVLGAWANIAAEYATKRYRSNLINWGMLPFLTAQEDSIHLGDYLFIPGIKKAIADKTEQIRAYVIGQTGIEEISMTLGAMTEDERQILTDGCLINHYRKSVCDAS